MVYGFLDVWLSLIVKAWIETVRRVGGQIQTYENSCQPEASARLGVSCCDFAHTAQDNVP